MTRVWDFPDGRKRGLRRAGVAGWLGGMSEWTEASLRAAASWQAFKEGKSLLERGAVGEALRSDGGWSGTVRGGKRPFKVRVAVRSATDLEVRCACPDNQSSGAVCAHAVATGLACLAGGVGGSGGGGGGVVLVDKPTAGAPPPAAVAWSVTLPPNWREAVVRGRLAATMAEEKSGEISAADESLQHWLAAAGVATRGTLNLALDGQRLAGFLVAMVGHPQVRTARGGDGVRIEDGGRIVLTTCERIGERVRLRADNGRTVRIGDGFWQPGEGSLTRIPTEGMASDDLELVVKLAAGQELELPLGRFLAALPAWQSCIDWSVGPWVDELHFVAATFQVEVALEGGMQSMEATVRIRYPDSEPVVPGLAGRLALPRIDGARVEVRDMAGEERVVRRLENDRFKPLDLGQGRWRLSGDAEVLAFLTHSLARWEREWEITSGSRFEQARRQVVVASPRITLLPAAGDDWLRFNLSFQTIDGIEVPAAEIRTLLRHGNRGKAGSGGRRLVVSPEVEELIDPLFSELDLRQEGGSYVASPAAGELVREIRKRLGKSIISNDESSGYPFEMPVGLHAELRAYQREGAGWLWDRVRRFGGALLADDMGLGKTLQTIALIERLFESGDVSGDGVLVVATASLLGNWRAEWDRFAPGREVRVLHGSGREGVRKGVGRGVVWLTSFGTLSRDLAWHLRQGYRVVVVDEASLMRNPDTDHAKALFKLKAGMRVALSGTPVENGVRDLWSIFRFIQPGWLGTREEFRDRYEVPLADADLAGGVLRRLRLKTSPFVLRRTKEQVAADLPAKLVLDEYCDLSLDQRAVYQQVLEEGRRQIDGLRDQRQDGAARMRMLTVLLRLRQTCCDLALLKNDRFNQLLVARRSAKLERLLRLLEEAVNGSHRVLVFSQFQTQLREIEKSLEGLGIGSLRLDGQTRNRQTLVDRFQGSDGPPVFLISLKAGGYGLNLTAADTVVHFDPWWNPAAEAQASDRAHRIGQTRPVTIYRLLTRGTVEEKVVRMQQRKRQLAAVIDEEGAGEAAGWSEAELLEVIRG